MSENKLNMLGIKKILKNSILHCTSLKKKLFIGFNLDKKTPQPQVNPYPNKMSKQCKNLR